MAMANTLFTLKLGDEGPHCGSTVTLSCHLSPETSAVAMEIRWLKRTDCICLYKNGQVTKASGYRGRVSLFTQELERGNVSLQLKQTTRSDAGIYLCQVTSDHRAEITLILGWNHERQAIIRKWNMKWTEEERRQMDMSVLKTEIQEASINYQDEIHNEALGKFKDLEVSDEEELKEESIHHKTVCKENMLLETSVMTTSTSAPENSPKSYPKPDLRLVLLGRTGSGKSAAANTILGREERSQAGTSTVTQQSESIQGEVAGRKVTVVDTPDWFCPELSLEEVRQDVGLCVRLSAPGPHGFLLVTPLNQLAEETRYIQDKMEEIFGERCWWFTIVLFTVFGELQDNSLEEHFVWSPELIRLVEKCGNRFHMLTIMDNMNKVQVSRLLEKIDEMFVVNKNTFYSSEVYLQTICRVREIEKKFLEQRGESKKRKERKAKEKMESAFQECLNKFTESATKCQTQINQHEDQISKLERMITEERDEEIKLSLQRDVENEIQQKNAFYLELERLKDESATNRKRIEDEHRLEMEKIMELYEGEARMEAERNLMKIILPELQQNLWAHIEKK